jgi:radical SAM peptide maturase (CXXX-repeat target family)
MLGRLDKVERGEIYQNFVMRLLHAKAEFEGITLPYNGPIEDSVGVKTITFQVTENCNLACTYCYQINKSKELLDFQKAKDFIDYLIKESYNEDSVLHVDKTPGIVIEFIGGEPLLEMDLIDKITDYFRTRLIEEHHPWAPYAVMSMISNGVRYMEDDVQAYFKKNEKLLSFGVSLDGCRNLHNMCRVFPDGTGSYDIAEQACKYHLANYDPNMMTKMTLAPENISYTFEAIVNLFNLGYKYVHGNCVYEDVWDKKRDPIIFYEQLKKLADYILDNELYNVTGTSLFAEEHFQKYAEGDDKNYCGSSCCMLAINNDGEIYPCIRFMKSSLGDNIQPYSIGTIKDGLGKSGEHKKRFDELYSITRTSQSDDKCNNCPIATGCGWCSGYNYQMTGSVNKRVVSICEMHQARCLANAYYWNKFYKITGEDKRFIINIPKDWALEIISEEEYNMLLEMSKGE